MPDSVTAERTGTCAECGSETVADGERAGVRAGRLLCSACADADVVYVSECLDCDFEYVWLDQAFSWYAARQRVQQEANTHEREKQTFENESHETVWRRIDDPADEVIERA